LTPAQATVSVSQPVLPTASLAATPTASAARDSTVTASQNIGIVIGVILGVILFVVVIALVLYKSRTVEKSSPSPEVELGLIGPATLEFTPSEGAWNTLLGSETENPVAQTIDPFGFDSDEH
jgi:uncharacterized protein (DUF58 family)